MTDGGRSDDDRGTSLSLLQRVRANDPDAWHRLVALYSPLVRFWCSRWGGRPDQLDDLAQEVFQAAAGSLYRFRRETAGDTFRGWLRGVARNVLRSHRRSSARHPRAQGGTEAMELLESVPGPADEPDEDDPGPEVNNLYRRALDLVRGEFEAKTWEMFWATTAEGRSPVDVATVNQVSAAAVRKAKSRVLRRLKQELGDLIEGV